MGNGNNASLLRPLQLVRSARCRFPGVKSRRDVQARTIEKAAGKWQRESVIIARECKDDNRVLLYEVTAIRLFARAERERFDIRLRILRRGRQLTRSFRLSCLAPDAIWIIPRRLYRASND